MVRILGIQASPRRHGNSETLLDSFLSGARAAGAARSKILLNDLHFKPCRECGICHNRAHNCALKDDLRRVYEGMDEADIVVVSSPIFFGSIPGFLKMMIDRFQPFWVKKTLFAEPPLTVKKRKGVFLCVSAAKRRDFFDNASKIIRIFFSVLNIEYAGGIYCGGVEGAGDIKRMKGVMRKARQMGAALAEKI